MDFKDRYSNWVEVDLDAIRNNIRLLSKQVNSQIMAIVKANAYGHGMVPVAQAALDAGAQWFGVARVDEALTLRRNGFSCPILLLGYTPPERYQEAIKNHLSITVWDREQIVLASYLGDNLGIPARLHIKVDTGMGRLGTLAENCINLAQEFTRRRGVAFEGVFTHFATADEADLRQTQQQNHRFSQLIKTLSKSGLQPNIIHAANSAATLRLPNTHFNLVRVGIAMYGLYPSKDCQLPEGFRPALSWKAVLSQVKTLAVNRGIGYGQEYVTKGEERIGTVPVGYADGYRRLRNNQVLIGEKCVPVVGRVSMDQINVQLDLVPETQSGDEVILIGQQGSAKITAEDVAERWGTINYEVTSCIGNRVPRFYLNKNNE